MLLCVYILTAQNGVHATEVSAIKCSVFINLLCRYSQSTFKNKTSSFINTCSNFNGVVCATVKMFYKINKSSLTSLYCTLTNLKFFWTKRGPYLRDLLVANSPFGQGEGFGELSQKLKRRAVFMTTFFRTAQTCIDQSGSN